MRVSSSAAFREFTRSQALVNQFLWSSEFAYELIRQTLLTPEVRAETRGVDEIFADVTCHAFLPSAKSRKAISAGLMPRHRSHYGPPVSEFESHLRLNLEPVCRYVIVRIHSVLERFLWNRAQPFLPLRGLSPRQLKDKKGKFQGTPYEQLARQLEQHTPLREPIERKTALLAQAFRLLRNVLVHKEVTFIVPWSDVDYRAILQSTFRSRDWTLIDSNLCSVVLKFQAKAPGTPALFFYALFCLTAYRNFAEAVDDALLVHP